MNYIKEINALYDRQEQMPLSGAAVTLWYALMHINNKTRWKNTFTSPGSVLRNKAGLTESSFKRARTELVEQGYIEVETQGRGKAPIYKMHSLVVELEQEKDALFSNIQPIDNVRSTVEDKPNQQVNEQVSNGMTQLVTHLPNQESAPLVKQYINKTNRKQNNRHKAKAAAAPIEKMVNEKKEEHVEALDAVHFYQENFGVASPFVVESLLDWSASMGEALVIEAMKRALERNKTSWGYVKSILNAWYKKGIRTLGDVKAEQVAFENERREKRGRGSVFFGGEKDIVPEWYEEEKKKLKKRKDAELTVEEEKEKQAEVEVLMEEYLGAGHRWDIGAGTLSRV